MRAVVLRRAIWRCKMNNMRHSSVLRGTICFIFGSEIYIIRTHKIQSAVSWDLKIVLHFYFEARIKTSAMRKKLNLAYAAAIRP